MQQETLRVIDAHRLQLRQNLRPVDEFRDSLYPDDAGDLRETPYRRLIERVVDHIPDELTVNLQVIHRKCFQIAERGCPGTEIIERHLDAEGADTLDEHRGVGHVGHGCLLRDLNADLRTDSRSVLAETIDRVPVKSPVSNRVSREIDR